MQEMVDISDDSLARSLMDAEAIKYAAVIVTNLPIRCTRSCKSIL